MERIEDKQRVTRLMLLFMATYLVSYLTRVNYAAVVTEIADAEGMAPLGRFAGADRQRGDLRRRAAPQRMARRPHPAAHARVRRPADDDSDQPAHPAVRHRVSDGGGLVRQRACAGVYVAAARAADVHPLFGGGL